MDEAKLHRELGEIASQLAHVGKAIEEAAQHRAEVTDRIARIETRLEGVRDAVNYAHQNELKIERVVARDAQGDEDRAETRARYALFVSMIALATSLISAFAPVITD